MGSVSRIPLLETTAADIPSEQVHRWFRDAQKAEIPLPTVASLATAALPSGRVSNRMVVVKNLTPGAHFDIYSDWDRSHKGLDVASNPHVALTFYWRELDRSLRVEGTLAKMSAEESRPYYESRTHDFQASVSLGNQTQVVHDRESLEERLQKLDATKELEQPPWWRGATVKPDYFEFWQGREDRLHDRLEYVLQDDGIWIRRRLTP